MSDNDPGYLTEFTYKMRRDVGSGLEEVELGSSGWVWLVYSLFGGHTLSHEVLSEGRFFRHKSGSTFTICPKGARAGHLLDFTGPSIGFSESSIGVVQDLISRRCSLERYLLVADDPVARPSDPWLVNKPEVQDQTFSAGDELYHWRRSSNSTAASEALGDLLLWTGYFPMNAFAIAEGRGDSRIGARSQVTADDLRGLAGAVQAIITSAYEDNGFVVWVAD